jgi:ribosomal protein S18 acetylase RimI-like enzyme
MDRRGWLELNRRSMEATLGCFVEHAGGRRFEAPGVFAVINPAVPERSVFNSVLYDDAQALRGAHERLAAAYAEHDCAWTVWVPEEDAEAASMLERAGHRLDAEPRAMGLELAGHPEPDLEGIEWSDDGDPEAMCLLNDRAFGYREGTWKAGTGGAPDGLRIYLAFVDGEPAATVSALEADGDCSIWNVATAEAARGRGLATALMRRALWDAARRGLATSTLQATKLGRPVYERVGYRDLGALQMWEYREQR